MATQEKQPESQPIAPYDQELEAMKSAAIAFDSLNDEQRARILYWLDQRYHVRRSMFG